MRFPLLLACAALTMNGLHAERLSEADREALLDNLAKLKAAADSRVDSRFRVALAAFRSAMSSDDAAIDLYLNCMERVNFQEEQRKAQDFREWKRNEAEKLADPGLRLALRHQLRWLVLTMQAAGEKPDRAKLSEEAGQVLDSIFRDLETLRGQGEMLGQSVMSSVFARAYDINNVKIENWPMSPLQLDAIFGEVILPPLRKPSRLADLRAAWVKRIQMEGSRTETWSKRENDDKRSGGGGISGESPEMLRFRETTLPKLQWEMETDLFRNGDESGAATQMLGLLEKHLGHPSAREWGEQFKVLLTPPAPAPKTTGETPDAGIEPTTE